MCKNLTLRFFLVISILFIFHSAETRTEQREKVTTSTISNYSSKKEVLKKSKKSVKRKKKFKVFQKIKQKTNKEPSEKWLTNRALIFGSVSWFLILIGALIFGHLGLALGAYLALFGLGAGIFAFIYGIGSRKRGIRNWKNNLGLIMGIITCGVAATYLVTFLIIILLVLALLG